MKKINDEEFNFVVEHYKENRIDTDSAWKKFKQRNNIKSSRNNWKSLSIAASVLFMTSITIACIVTGYNPFKSVIRQPNNSDKPLVDTIPDKVVNDSVKVFKFNDEPVGKVLKELSSYYGKTLSTSDSTKVLSGEIEATSCEDMVSIIETTLDIKIKVE